MVLEMNGNDIEEVVDTLSLAKMNCGHGKPVVILMHTEMGYGVDYMMGTHEWHGVAPNDDEAEVADAIGRNCG